MAADKSAAMDTFKRFDIDKNGLISYDELEALFSEIGGFASKEDLRKIIESVDEDNDGCINFQEFLALSMKLQSEQTEQSLQKLFSTIDSDGDRFLTRDELCQGMTKFLGKAPTESQLDTALQVLDTNMDNKISYKEFADSILCRLHAIILEEEPS
ncbi:calmodulin-4-like [Bolinopsis microptera]|uniref:calmodulin-4-like n=1 Tax=Bolinopsis microptera TaxID=2820187 RepID=UPI00307AB91D